MITRKPVVFCGPHNAGKDAAAKFLCANYQGMTYGRSISYYLAEYVAECLDVSIETLRGPKRHKYAKQFFTLGEKARDDDRGLFIRQALEVGNVVTGIRDPREIDWGRQQTPSVFFVWIDRPVPDDPTMIRYGAEECDVTISNYGSLETFHQKLRRWADFSGFLRLDNCPPLS